MRPGPSPTLIPSSHLPPAPPPPPPPPGPCAPRTHSFPCAPAPWTNSRPCTPALSPPGPLPLASPFTGVRAPASFGSRRGPAAARFAYRSVSVRDAGGIGAGGRPGCSPATGRRRAAAAAPRSTRASCRSHVSASVHLAPAAKSFGCFASLQANGSSLIFSSPFCHLGFIIYREGVLQEGVQRGRRHLGRV